jgi:Zn-finger nucleic acid-binding protein
VSESRRTLVCPRCGAPLPPGAAHESVTCVFCGTTSAVSQLANEAAGSELVCPRCEQKLFFGDADGVAMLGCGVCGGIWLDNGSAHKVTEHYSDRVVDMAARAAQSAQRKPDVRAAAKCAQCRAEMQRRTFGVVSLDVCAEHGTWFDAGELSTLVAPMRPAPQVQMAPAQFDAPANPDWDRQAGSAVLSAGSEVAGDVALAVAEGAFGVLLGILTD